MRSRVLGGQRFWGNTNTYEREISTARKKAQAIRNLGFNVRTIRYRPNGKDIYLNLVGYNRRKKRKDWIDLNEKSKPSTRRFPSKLPFFMKKEERQNPLDDLWRGPLVESNFSWGPSLKGFDTNEKGFSARVGISSPGDVEILLYPGQLQGLPKQVNQDSLEAHINRIMGLYGINGVPFEETLHNILKQGNYQGIEGDLFPLIAYSDEGILPSEEYHDGFYDPSTYIVRDVEEAEGVRMIIDRNGQPRMKRYYESVEELATAGGHARWGFLHFACGDKRLTPSMNQILENVSGLNPQGTNRIASKVHQHPYNEQAVEEELINIVLKAKEHLNNCPHCAQMNPGYVSAWRYNVDADVRYDTVSDPFKFREKRDRLFTNDNAAIIKPDIPTSHLAPFDSAMNPEAWGRRQNPRFDQWLRLLRNQPLELGPEQINKVSFLDGLLVDAKNSATTQEMLTGAIDDTVMEYLRDNNLTNAVPFSLVTNSPDPWGDVP